jgi:hypothetical protein
MVKKAALVLSSVFLLAACAGNPPGIGTGSAYNGTFRGDATGWCNVPGNFIHAYFQGGVEVHRDIFENGNVALVPCGTKPRDEGLCFGIAVNGPRLYNDQGQYIGSLPIRAYSVQIPCPGGPQGVKFFNPYRYNRW